MMKYRLLLSFSRLLVLSVVLLSISSCGFQLRGSQQFPEHIQLVEVRSLSAHDPQARALAERLPVYQLGYTRAAAPADIANTVIIELRPENLDRRLLSVFRTGQVAEYELIYRVDYRLTFPGQEPVNAVVEVLREYQDDPDQVLAKSRELDLILDEMRAEAADRIIRLMASQASVPAVAVN
ncbi:LPS assembly lipoprotein LptE [Alteromonas sp. ASW11-36]|uniref:LPS-assembly lipoprotein LptE n=1 Tax=Alteromonas arenosi TaxID=3055817 RepID=A0ABT7SWR0_9ALTE|nr:LPS assembly lipoprotein LptE [Alteromonas sp. ASW11-36]MDM7860635.1 LPS assembly lipoprotein LptE [Alteromonas sp. ASW11-36]